MMGNNNEFIKLDGNAEFKFYKFIDKVKEIANELYEYMSYRIDMEPCNGNHTIVLKIDSVAYYTSKYINLKKKMNINMPHLARAFNFPESVIIEFNNYRWPYATMYVYYIDDKCDVAEYCIGMPNNNQTLESMIIDIEELWMI